MVHPLLNLQLSVGYTEEDENIESSSHGYLYFFKVVCFVDCGMYSY